MQNPERLQSIYTNTILPLLTPLEVARKKVMRNLWLLVLGVAAFVAVGFYVDIGMFGVILLVLVILFYYRHHAGIMKGKYKGEDIPAMLTSLAPGLSYDPGRAIARSSYDRSKIFPQSINIYYGDDFVSGMLGKTAIQFSELHTQHETGSGKNRSQVDVFRGIFFIADFNKKFNGETFVLPDRAGFLGGLGNLIQKMNFVRPQLVKMEDVEFEKAFVVYSSDQVEARYILSPALMQRITEFRKSTKMRIALSFVDSHVFIALPINRRLFEAPPLFSSVLNRKLTLQYLGYLSICIEIVEALDLNTRIWTKE